MSDYITETLDYSSNSSILQAYIAKPNNNNNNPVVLICHAWAGRDGFVEDTAIELAKNGYVGVALDVYGKGVLGSTTDEKIALMQPLMDNRAELQARLKAGYNEVLKLDNIDNSKISALGYCFGGLCVLDMARMGIALKSVISTHGLFVIPDNLSNYKIKSRVLALHGHLDPMVSTDNLNDFIKELDSAEADWQINTYGKALHAFTNPDANDYDLGTVYHKQASNSAWDSILQFLNESNV